MWMKRKRNDEKKQEKEEWTFAKSRKTLRSPKEKEKNETRGDKKTRRKRRKVKYERN